MGEACIPHTRPTDRASIMTGREREGLSARAVLRREKRRCCWLLADGKRGLNLRVRNSSLPS
eukprot:scaffold243085_cov36-Tisochrysis_lutea.AAC.6